MEKLVEMLDKVVLGRCEEIEEFRVLWVPWVYIEGMTTGFRPLTERFEWFISAFAV